MRLAIVFGSSKNALAELEAARAFARDHGIDAPVIAVKRAFAVCSVKPAAFTTLHPESILRDLDGVDTVGVQLFAQEQGHISNADMPKWKMVRERWGGTSGLYGVQIALDEMGFDGVIVAGVPICDNEATAYRLPQGRYIWANGYIERYRKGWTKALPVIAHRVRSMSGWTQELLGAPSPEWIAALSARG